MRNIHDRFNNYTTPMKQTKPLTIFNLTPTHLQKTYQVAAQVTMKVEQLTKAGHYNSDFIRTVGESVSNRWRQMVFYAEERIKLVLASTNWFKTAEQVLVGDHFCINIHLCICIKIYHYDVHENIVTK